MFFPAAVVLTNLGMEVSAPQITALDPGRILIEVQTPWMRGCGFESGVDL